MEDKVRSVSKERLWEVTKKFIGNVIVIIGEVIIDEYAYGRRGRYSREAKPGTSNPYIYEWQRSEYYPGGAGNTAAGVVGLGGKVSLVSVVGDDPTADYMRKTLEQNRIGCEFLIPDHSRPTSHKERRVLIDDRGQICGIDGFEDRELRVPISEEIQGKIFDSIPRTNGTVVVLSDYLRGMFADDEFVKKLVARLKKEGKTIIVDSRPNGHLTYDAWRGVDLITPSVEEAVQILRSADQEVSDENSDENTAILAEKLSELLDCNVLITRNSKGMTLFEKGQEPISIGHLCEIEAVDVNGAGDSVVAVVSAALAAGATLLEASLLGNLAGGIAVCRQGTATISLDDLREDIKRLPE